MTKQHPSDMPSSRIDMTVWQSGLRNTPIVSTHISVEEAISEAPTTVRPLTFNPVCFPLESSAEGADDDSLSIGGNPSGLAWLHQQARKWMTILKASQYFAIPEIVKIYAPEKVQVTR